MKKTVNALLLLTLCISFECFSQDQPKQQRIAWGFLTKSNINSFSTNDPTTTFKTDIGWGLGYLLVAHLNSSIAASLEPSINFENHSLFSTTTNSTLRLKDMNTVIPLKINVKIFKDLSLNSGLEYLVVQSKQKQEVKLTERSFLASVGASYAIRFKYFSIAPEVSYRRGLSNALEKNELNTITARRSSVSVGVKIM